MRVLTVGNLYPPHGVGGYEVTWQSSVRWLRERGHTVSVLTTDWRRPGVAQDSPEDDDVQRELRWYWHDHSFPHLPLRERVALERHNARTFDRHLEKLRPDAICWWAMGGMSLSLIERARRRGLPAVGVVGDDWMRYGPNVDAWLRAARRPVLGRLAGRLVGVPARVELRSAAIWLFNSERTRSAALELGPLDDARVVRPGVDEGVFRAAPEREWSWRLLYAGRIDPRKGIATAVEALAALPPEAALEIVGDGEPRERERLRALAARHGVEEQVLFRGALAPDDMPHAYATADAVIFPVEWDEPWGLAPLEAMAVGRPVVATGAGGSREYLRDGENCLLFGRGDARALAACVERVAGDPALRGRLRDGGRATAARYPAAAYDKAIAAALDEAVARASDVAHMREFWDARARENALYFVDKRLDYRSPDREQFWEAGTDALERILGSLGVDLRSPDHVVEIGCGVGRLTRAIAQRVEHVTALDISAEMLDRARQLNPELASVRWIHGDGTTLASVADASADACLSLVVLQHIPDPSITLGYVREMGRVLRPGGWSAFQVSNDPAIHDPALHRPPLGRRLAAFVGRSPRGEADRAWIGSAIDLDDIATAAESAGMHMERVDGAGTQFCLVLLRKRVG